MTLLYLDMVVVDVGRATDTPKTVPGQDHDGDETGKDSSNDNSGDEQHKTTTVPTQGYCGCDEVEDMVGMKKMMLGMAIIEQQHHLAFLVKILSQIIGRNKSHLLAHILIQNT